MNDKVMLVNSAQQSLAPGEMLRHFQIGSVLGQGSFCIAYAAQDTDLLRKVAIKEFLPVALALREPTSREVLPRAGREGDFRFGLEQFLEGARTLARFSHPNIVRVLSFFQENGTGYLVMEWEEGQSLDTWLKGRAAAPDEATLRGILLPILRGLAAVHEAGILHRCVKPATLYLRDEGEPLLIDLGAARQAIGARDGRESGIESSGYAPPEQYATDASKQGPWTDLYGVGATLYRCISGADPVDSMTRREALIDDEPDPLVAAVAVGRGRYSEGLLALIDRLLTPGYRQRPQSVAAVLADLDGGPSLPTGCGESGTFMVAEEDKGSGRPSAAADATGRRGRLGVLFGLSLLLGGLGAGLWWGGQAAVSGEGPDGAAGSARSVGTVFQDSLKGGGEGPELVVLPTGSFRMGDLDGGGYEAEQPVRKVTISRPFAMMTHEVTFAQYDRYAQATGRDKPDDKGWGRGDRPVINVNWNDAQAYANWLSGQTGKRYRLPSEAEWEYAARAGSRTAYTWGDSIGSSRANCDTCDSRWDGSQTALVGSFAANAWGLYDMHGNVWEWVEDCWHGSYSGAPTDGSVWPGGDCEDRVLRGGAWNSPPAGLRSAYRAKDAADLRYIIEGFRLVRDL